LFSAIPFSIGDHERWLKACGIELSGILLMLLLMVLYQIREEEPFIESFLFDIFKEPLKQSYA